MRSGIHNGHTFGRRAGLWHMAELPRNAAAVVLLLLFFLQVSWLVGQQARRQAGPAPQQTAASATLLMPSDVAYDSAGNLFFVDSKRHQVFEVSLAGTLSVVAGTGEQGFGGDGGPATSALFNAPHGIAIGADGTLYIADTGNQRIRSISGGVVRTVAGTGERGASGDGGAAIAAKLNQPSALAIDAQGNLLVCDTGNHRVRRISNGVIATVAGDGTEGFSGDAGLATVAQLDSPTGVAVAPDGRIFVADSRNHRIRVVGIDAKISTFAGSGARGFSGDGGPAPAARLFLPRGLTVMPTGAVVFADSNNQRVRSVDAQGVISTIAGDGWQGSSADASVVGSASLDSPRAVSPAPYGIAAITDPHNHLVREVAADGHVYIVAAPLARTTTVTLNVPQDLVYGTGGATVEASGNAAAPEGSVSLLENGVSVGVAKLAGGMGALPLGTLSVGIHAISAAYAGDGLNPAASSTSTSVTIAPAEAVATADAQLIAYGQQVPQLTGNVAGVLPQDAAGVSVSFTSSAGPLSAAGTYPIFGQLHGAASGNYKLVMSAASGQLKIVQAQSTIALQSPAQVYAGLPLVLTATLGSVTSGTPTGEVVFADGGAVVARANAVSGRATATYLAPGAGTHVITASYAGDNNFLGSNSAGLTATISAVPDFTLAASAPTQSVQAGLIASYPLSLTPTSGPFTGSVSLSVSGLPTGAQASFTPVSVVPGAGGANVTLNVQTPATIASRPTNQAPAWSCLLMLFLAPAFRKRCRWARVVCCLCAGLLLTSIIGCGARTVGSAAQAERTFPLTVTATSTDLAGHLVTHTAALTLTVR